MFNLPFTIPGMPGGAQNPQGGDQDPQAAAAAKVKAGSKPSLLTLQNAMGGLLGHESGREAAQGLLGDVSGAFGSSFNDLANFATSIFGSNPATSFFGQLTGQDVTPPTSQIPDGGVIQQPVEEPPPVVEPPPPKVPTADNGWGGVKTDFDAINWALQRGDITADEARWLMKWQQGDANGDTNFVDGGRGTRNWDYWKSDLTDRNKRIVDKFYNAVSGNWGEAPAGAQQKQKPPQQENLLGVDPAAIQAAAARYRGGMR